MTQLVPIDPDQAVGESAVLLAQVRDTLGMVPALMRLLSHSPAALVGFLALRASLHRATLPAQLRERIAIAVAAINSCDCCAANHRRFAQHAGVGESECDAAREATSSEPAAAAALRFARVLIETRGRVDDVELARVREAGFDDAAIVEIVAVAATNMFANFVNNLGRSAPDTFLAH